MFLAVVTRTLSLLMLSPATQPAAGLQAGDLVRVSVEDIFAQNRWEDFDRRVDRDGNISLPMLGEVKAIDMTPDQLAARVDRTFCDRGTFQHMSVKARLVENAKDAKVKPGPPEVGDTLLLRVWDVEAQNQETRLTLVVDDKGEITLPLVNRIRVVGLKDAEIESHVDQAYRDGGWVMNAGACVLRIAEAKETAKR